MTTFLVFSLPEWIATGRRGRIRVFMRAVFQFVPRFTEYIVAIHFYTQGYSADAPPLP